MDSRFVLSAHHQISPYSCIPSALELVLKLEGVLELDRHDLQERHFENKKLDFGKFHEFKERGLTFHAMFAPGCELAKLRSAIELELASGRYVVVALQEEGAPEGETLVHAWVVIGRRGSEFVGVSRCQNGGPLLFEPRIWARVEKRGGTDIMVYRLEGDETPLPPA